MFINEGCTLTWNDQVQGERQLCQFGAMIYDNRAGNHVADKQYGSHRNRDACVKLI